MQNDALCVGKGRIITAKTNNKYKNLLLNTLIFGIGTFGSKLLVYFMLPLYTSALTAAEYGVTDLITQTANLLLPLACLGMTSSIVRFGLDNAYRKDTVFTTALAAVAVGFTGLLIFWPLLAMVKSISDYVVLVYLYVLMSTLKTSCAVFVRSMNRVKLFAYDGVQSTLLTILFTLLFLLKFDMGITGYVLAIVAADFCSAVFLFVTARLWRYVNLSSIDKQITGQMLRYCLPLIPASLFWWVTNVSDRYMVTYMIDETANGLYSVSYKIPTLINLLSTIFMEAWHMSAITEKDSPQRAAFFSKVFRAYSVLLFCAASFLSLTCRFFMKYLVADSYFIAWKFIPVLVMAIVFCCFCNFLNSIYVVERKSTLSLLTVMAGAAVNIVLNLIWIPRFGVMGAAAATLASYVVVFILRAYTTRRMIPMRINFFRLGFNCLLILAQAVLMVMEVPHNLLWSAILFTVLCVLNLRTLLTAARDMLQNRRKKA